MLAECLHPLYIPVHILVIPIPNWWIICKIASTEINVCLQYEPYKLCNLPTLWNLPAYPAAYPVYTTLTRKVPCILKTFSSRGRNPVINPGNSQADILHCTTEGINRLATLLTIRSILLTVVAKGRKEPKVHGFFIENLRFSSPLSTQIVRASFLSPARKVTLFTFLESRYFTFTFKFYHFDKISTPV